MLKSLHIENIAVIEKADISFDVGFQVITGETGAGKSILIDSINFILGNRANREIIRTGCEKAVVSAVFSDVSAEVKNKLSEYGIDCDDDLIIQRNFSSDGKNTARINGLPATLSMIKDIGSCLVSFHGQHENNNLLDNSHHLYYLDAFAANAKERGEYLESYKKVRSLQKELRKLNLSEKEREIRLETLAFTVDEIEKAGLFYPKNGEEDEETRLTKLQTVLFNKEHLREYSDAAWEKLAGDGGALALLYEALQSLSYISGYDGRLAEIEKNAEQTYTLAETVKDDLRDFRYEMFGEGETLSLDEVAERLSLFERLEKKYHKSFSELLPYKEECEKELERLSESERNTEDLKETLRAEIRNLREKAAKLTESRRIAGEKLSERIVSELKFLDMPSVKFECKITETEPAEKGFDSVEFLMSANPGEELRPIAKIASGGELSRIMLGIKSALSDAEDSPTLIFDEIDTGVSGRAAQKIALKLALLSKNRQVFVVTHLVQMAAMGDGHLLISKKTENGKTYTEVKKLSEEERVSEIARILGGVEITESILSTAKEMLVLSSELKNKHLKK